MERPSPFLFNGVNVYNADDIKTYDPAFFYGCAKTVRMIVDRKSIPESMYFYCVKNKEEMWKLSTSAYSKSKLLLMKDWVESNVPKMVIDSSHENVETPKPTYEVEPAPPLLELKDYEKMKDNDGNVFDIEVRGERHYKKCYLNWQMWQKPLIWSCYIKVFCKQK
jgi:hypothetical protein